MSRKYKFKNPEGVYFVTFAVVGWIDVFTRDEYRKILLDSLRYCQCDKGLEIFAWCIMPNHVHLIARSKSKLSLSEILRDFKGYTSKCLIKSIQEHPRESRKSWILKELQLAGSMTSNVKKFQFWRHDNKPIELWSALVFDQKVEYIHNNPVAAGLCIKPEDFPYSSALDYAGLKGELDITIVDLNSW